LKKTLFLLLVTLFLLTGCRENYFAEKMFYHAEKKLRAAQALDLTKVGTEALNPAIVAFEEVAETYPSTPKAVQSLFMVSKLRTLQQDYEAARGAMNQVVRNLTGRKVEAAQARFEVARLYELEGRWKDAEAAYWETAEYHPMQEEGLYAPLTVVLHYRRTKDQDKWEDAYFRAIQHYKRMITEIGPIEASGSLKYHLALTHLAYDRPEEAADAWLSIHEEFQTSPFAPLAMIAVAELTWKQGDYNKSFNEYSRYFMAYPGHELAGKMAIRVGTLHDQQGQYEQARSWYEQAFKYFTNNRGATARIKLLLGKSFQSEGEGKWEAADQLYSEIEKDYAFTTSALQVPFVRYLHYKEVGNQDEAFKILDTAIAHYKDLVSKYPNSRVAAFARQYMHQALVQKEDWAAVMQNFDIEMARETIVSRKGRWLFLKALVAQNRLQDHDRAVTLYENFLSQYPDHPLEFMAKQYQQSLSTSDLVPAIGTQVVS